MANVFVLGAGMMGTALVWPLADNGHRVKLVGTHLDRDIVLALRQGQPHPGLGVRPPNGVEPYFIEELGAVLEKPDLVCVGVSSAGVQWAAETLAGTLESSCPVVMISKGLHSRDGTLELLPHAFARKLGLPAPAPQVMAIAGPCIAGELARRVGTRVLVAGPEQGPLQYAASLLTTDYYHLQASTDLIGVEACAALKNAYAMGIAFASGMHEKRGGEAGSIAMHNVEAASFAQSIIEMQRIVKALGGDPGTVAGLAGVGDLDVTCNGGRTGRFGKLLGSGLSVDEARGAMPGATLECLEILATLDQALHGLRDELDTNALPLLNHMLDVALRGAPVRPPLELFV